MEKVIMKTKDKFHIKKNDESRLNSLVFPKGNIVELSDGLFFNTTRIGNDLLQEVHIPDTVQVIGDKCFKNCTAIESVTIPDTVTELGNACFRGCKKLKMVRLPNNMQILPEYFLSWCSSLSQIHIPDGVTTILDGCFTNCTNLKSITLPETVSKIGEFVFSQCTSLENFTFNDSIENIGEELFLDCENLEAVTLPVCLDVIGRKAFSGCYNLKNIKLPMFVSVIGENAFEECSSLTDITIPSSVTYIGSEAFNNCTNLENVTILPKLPQLKKLLIIEDGAFSECSNIKSLDIPKGALNNEAAFDFSNMPNLKSIRYAGRNILNLSEDETFNNLLYNGRLIYTEYTNQSGEIVSRVLEDSSSNKRDIRSIELTKLFNKLCNHDIFQKGFKFDTDRNRLCLNMLSVLNYTTCMELLNLLQERKGHNNADIDKDKKNKNKQNKLDNQEEAEGKEKKSIYSRLKEIIIKFSNKKHKKTDIQQTEEIRIVDFIKTLFSSPKTYGNTTVNDFIKFFSDNISDIVNITNSEDLENLARIQRNFQAYTKNPILRKKIQSGRFTLCDALQSKSLYITAGHPEEFANASTERQMYEEYHKKSVTTKDIEL